MTIQRSQPNLITIQQTLNGDFTAKDNDTCIEAVLESFFEATYQGRALNEYQMDVDQSLESLGSWVLGVENQAHSAVVKLAEVEQVTQTILKTIVHTDDLTDDQRDEIIRQFPVWLAGMDYQAYDVVNYDGTLYEVIQGHTSQDDWRPDDTPALYAEYLNITITDPDTGEKTEIISDWKQPAGEHDAYSIGDKVRFNGEVYQSNRDDNVWSPADLPSGWDLIK